MNASEQISGIIDRFLYQDNSSGFSIFVLQLSETETAVAKGSLAHVSAGTQVLLSGSWTMHPKFGKQFEVTAYQTSVPATAEGLIRYLGSGLISGIGPTYAQKLVARFGTQVLEVIEKMPHRLASVPGIGPKRLEKIVQAWHEHKEVANVMVFLQDKQISPAYAVKIYKTYGQQAIEIVSKNPYRLAEEVWGIGFTIADQIATELGIAPDSIERIKAGILFAIKQEVDQGHIYVESETLKQKTITLLKLEIPNAQQLIKTGLRHLYDEQKIVVVSVKEEHFLTMRQHYLVEKATAQKIKKLCEHPSELHFDCTSIEQQLKNGDFAKNIFLNEEQQAAIISSLRSKLTIITGGPGTGKTTIIKVLLSILEHHSISYVLAAPTGRAAKRITESTGKNAQTIHRLLEFDVSTYQFSKDESNALKASFIILDEASMIDIFLAHSLLKAVSYQAHVVFIGDVDQLPSVGAGHFLHDLIASKQLPCITLKTIFRQAQQSLIVINAHRINQGEFPISSAENAERDFIFIKEDDPEQVSVHLQHIFNKQLARSGISIDDTIILSPMNRGITGTQNLNNSVQNMVNQRPATEEHITRGNITFKLHDRVMQLRNNYDKLVFNGDIGTVEKIDIQESIIVIRFGPQLVEYQTTEIDELALAYAITIHKSQGSEFSAVIVPLFMQHYMLLQRNLIYTAITRAKKLCIFIGQTRAIGIAVNNNKSTVRKTFLREYLTSNLECR